MSHKQLKRGATLTGYGLVVGLIAIVALGAVTNIGDQVQSLFTEVSDELGGVIEATPPTGTETLPSGGITFVTQSGGIRFSDGGEADTCKGYLVGNVASGYPSVPGNNAGDDGVYWINPTGSQPIRALCDMSTDSGGWTLVARDDNSTSLNGDNSAVYYMNDYPGSAAGYRMADAHYAALVAASDYGRHFYELHTDGTRRYWPKSQMSGTDDQTRLLYDYCSSCGDKRWSMFQSGNVGFAGFDRSIVDSAFENISQQGAWDSGAEMPTGATSSLRYWNFNSGITNPYNLNLTIWMR